MSWVRIPPVPCGIRLQMTVYDRLVAEVIVENVATANTVFARWCQAKLAAGKPFGGAMTSRADLPRYWDVPLGAVAVSRYDVARAAKASETVQ